MYYQSESQANYMLYDKMDLFIYLHSKCRFNVINGIFSR